MSEQARIAYDWLNEYLRETSTLASMGNVLGWDQRTYIPDKGHGHRAEQMAMLTKVLHRRVTDPEVGHHLEQVEGTSLVVEASTPEAVNVREWRRAYNRLTRIPERLAVELARATSEGETAWEQARPENDWPRFQPHLQRILSLKQEEADALGHSGERYDALLDEYEPGATAAQLEPLFRTLQKALSDLLRKIDFSRYRPPVAVLRRHFPRDAQAAFGREVAAAIGFDFEAGRLDVSAHPFTIGIGPGDTRITTRYAEDFFSSALFGTIHEAGHALYDQGLPIAHWGTPRGEAVSLGVHESQSRLWENLVARSEGFWRWLFPKARKRFEALRDVDLGTFLGAIRAVEPSLIRVEADQVTYNLHILVRFELELSLLRGQLPVADLPEAFDSKMEAILGLRPPDLKSGVMQDVHWAAGLIGYFPTYTLGNVYSAQLFAAAGEQLGDLQEAFARGEFAPLLGWLREKIHGPGSTFRPHDLIARVTGAPPSSEHLIRHLETLVDPCVSSHG